MAEHNGTAEAVGQAAEAAQGGTGWEAYALLLALLGLAVVAAWLIDRIVVGLFRYLVRRTRSTTDDVLVEALHRPLLVILSVVFALVLIRLAWVEARVPAPAIEAFLRFQVALLVIAGAYTLVRFTRVMLARPGARFARVAGVSTLVGRLVAVLVYTVAFLMVLDQYGISITPVLTSLGIAGLAVALALQDTLANFFAGMWIQTGRAMRPGHFIRLEDQKLEGTVSDVGWRTTLIRTVQNNIVVVPNAKLAQAIVTDHNIPDPSVSSVLPFTTAFDVDPEHVHRIVLEELDAQRSQSPAILPTPPLVRLNGFGDFGLQWILIFFVTAYGEQFHLQNLLRRRLLRRFREEGIRIPFPTQELIVPGGKTHPAMQAGKGVPQDEDDADADAPSGGDGQGGDG